MARTREIKRRMTAVGTIARITKTMQMIATAKFTAALQRASATKPYTETLSDMVAELASTVSPEESGSPLLNAPTPARKRELLLVVSSDRGLCGAYNANVLRVAARHLRKQKAAGVDTVVETVGKKAVGFFQFQGTEIANRYELGDKPAYEAVEAIASGYMDRFSAGEFDAVRVAFMRFVSNARQTPEIVQVLPLEAEAVGEEASSGNAGCEFSPQPAELLADLIPLAVKSRLFQCVNDGAVSEQIMRMIAMKAATENARDLRKTLSRDFNRARQGQITTELTEIISGVAALE